MAVKRGGLGRGLDALIPDKNAGQRKESAGKKADSKKVKTTEAKASSEVKTAAKEPAKKTSSKKTANKETAAAEKSRMNDPIMGDQADGDRINTKKGMSSEKQTLVSDESMTSPQEQKPENPASDHVVLMKISRVEPNREQPRKEFDKEKLAELAESIKQYGVIQPLLVQKNDNYYEIIAGERRWRASQMAGLKEIPVIIRDYTEQEVVEISLIENIQREDLNPIEEANAYVRLMEEFHLTQEKIAERVSRSRAAVTNAVRLLKLPEEIRTMLVYGDLTEGHARALLGIPDPEKQITAARKVVADGLSVRDTEKLVKTTNQPPIRRPKAADPQNDIIFRDLEEQLKAALGTKVAIHRKSKSKGRIEIEYYSSEELERLLDLIRSAGKQGDY